MTGQHGIYVVHEGRVHYVGSRPTRTEAEETAAVYNRDPLAQGWYYTAPEPDYSYSAEEGR